MEKHTASIVKGTVPIQISFIHPLKNIGMELNKRRVKKSSGLTDYRQAQKVKQELDAILSDPSRWNSIGDVLPITREFWTLKVDAHDPAVVGMSEAVGLSALGMVDEAESNERIRQKNETIRLLELKIQGLEALLHKLTGNAVSDFKPYIIETAINDFLSNDKRIRGTNADERKKKSYRAWLNRFAKENAGQDCNIISAERVIAHLADIECGNFNDGVKPQSEGVKKNGQILVAFMNFATKGNFKAFAVKEWMKRNLETSDENKEDLWLDETEWKALAGAMENKLVAALATLSFWSGFRAEELAFLVRDRITVDKAGDTRVELDKILDDKNNVVWKPKTPDSYGSVHIHPRAIKALKTLLDANAGSFLLLPNPTKIRKEGFRKQNKLWTGDEFTSMYLAELRGGANKLGWTPERLELLDSRTPRRSCGKRVLLATDLKTAARVLRDSEATVKKHYARILPDNVRITA